MRLLPKIVGLSPHSPPQHHNQHIVLVSNFLNLAIFVGKKRKQKIEITNFKEKYLLLMNKFYVIIIIPTLNKKNSNIKYIWKLLSFSLKSLKTIQFF
jgi:hypothetical protein